MSVTWWVLILIACLLGSSVTGRWLLWLFFSLLISFARWMTTLYQLTRICVNLVILFVLDVCARAVHIWEDVTCPHNVSRMSSRLADATTYAEWREAAAELDELSGKKAWREVKENDPMYDHDLLVSTMAKLKKALADEDVQQLAFMMRSLMRRDIMGIDRPALHTVALDGTKRLIEEFVDIMNECLRYICDSKNLSPEQKLSFFRNADVSLGQTALGLSGGGSLGMYHMGVCLALLEANCLPRVITGASGGSIIAAMLAGRTVEELLADIFVPDISTRFMHEGIRWFPPITTQVVHFIQNGVLIDGEEFEKTTERYYGDMTFEEGYQRTGRHVNITISASSATMQSGGSYKLILNHITTPHVLLASAVRASCALPGIMCSASLLCKNEHGQIVPYLLARDMRWVDGSVTSDIPRQRVAALFNVTNFLVSQVNPHIVPFVRSHSPGAKKLNFLSHVADFVGQDIRARCLVLANFGVIPRLFGQEAKKMLTQQYMGHVTFVPALRLKDSFNAILNPTVEDMNRYILGGRRSAWPQLAYVRHLMSIETVLQDCLAKLTDSRVDNSSAMSEGTDLASLEKDALIRSLQSEVEILRRNQTFFPRMDSNFDPR